MTDDSRKTLKKGGAPAAMAAVASAALLVPAGLAQGANRLSKKLNMKAVQAQIKANKAKLWRQAQLHPEAALSAPAPELEAWDPRRKARAGRATASQVAKTTCKVDPPFFSWTNSQSGSRPITMTWDNSATCRGKVPVLVQVGTDMVDPSGVHNPSFDAGVNNAQATGLAFGPTGTWKMVNGVSFAVPPPYKWSVRQGKCVGGGTPVVTCGYGFPIHTV
jgi:hypothetical protein